MGYLDDVSTIVKAASTAKDFAFKNQHKSIARGALEGTLQFPCLVSDAIPVDMATTVAKTLERVYASFVQTYLSLHNTIDISVDKNPNQFLKKFHHNVRLESAMDLYHEHCIETDEEYDQLMERIYNGTTKAYINERENTMLVFNISEKMPADVFNSHKMMLEKSLSGIDYAPFPNIGNSPFYEADDDFPKDSSDELKNDIIATRAREAIKSQNRRNEEFNKQQMQNLSGDNMTIPSLLKDSDIKKQNDLQPYLMQVRLLAINDKKEFVQFMDFVVGIKVVLHGIKSNEMIANIEHTLHNNGKLFNFIRWTSGEKSLFKDLLLHINDVKLDAANRSKGSSAWWGTLKRMKETSRVQGAFFFKTKLVPNSTIVISSYEADIILKNYGYNLRDGKNAAKLMNSLFLMNFVIIDEGTRTIEILYDGETTYQTYALETLEREISMNSNKLGKELTRMISR